LESTVCSHCASRAVEAYQDEPSHPVIGPNGQEGRPEALVFFRVYFL
jgi:hypothetical protein